MMMMVFRKFTVFPSPSVNCPSSNTCNNILKTSECAFSISSRRMTRSEEHTSELQSHSDIVCRLLLEKKKKCMKSNTLVKAGGLGREVHSHHLDPVVQAHH